MVAGSPRIEDEAVTNPIPAPSWQARRDAMRDGAQYAFALDDENKRLRAAIREALDFESVLPAISTRVRQILTAALNDEGNES